MRYLETVAQLVEPALGGNSPSYGVWVQVPLVSYIIEGQTTGEVASLISWRVQSDSATRNMIYEILAVIVSFLLGSCLGALITLTVFLSQK